MTENCYVLCVPSWKRRRLFVDRKWHTDSGNLRSVGTPRLRGMRNPVAVPRAKVKGITDGRWVWTMKKGWRGVAR